jgi:predicted nucleotide-binding protein with TIR-like domain
MLVTRRVYVSLPADQWLSPSMNDLKWAIVDEIENLGYTPEIFTNPRGKPGLASSRAWGARDADEVARRCLGAAVIGMARWKFHDAEGRDVRLPTEFSHYEGSLARTLGLPTLVLVQSDVLRRVVFDPTFGGFVGEIPPEGTPDWLKTPEFRVPFGYWRAQLNARRDVFLGYCSSSRATAASLKSFLQSGGATVLDWQTDFIAGRSILAQIEEAATRCNAGIFLFTKDDDLADQNKPDKSAPRDNVVFEAGYFIGLKGKRNVLIVREQGSKMPADLGGDIYALLQDRVDIGPIERVVSGFISAL